MVKLGFKRRRHVGLLAIAIAAIALIFLDFSRIKPNKPKTDLDELKESFDIIKEDQVQSSYDTVLLLLLPLTTTLAGYASTQSLSTFPKFFCGLLAVYLLVALVIFVYGKVMVSNVIKAFAWFFSFIAFSSSLTFVLLLWLVEIRNIMPSLLFFTLGCFIIGFAVSYRPARRLNQIMQQRMPMRAPEINRAFLKLYEANVPGTQPYLDYLLLCYGVGLTIFSIVVGQSRFPSVWLWSLFVFSIVCFLFYAFVLTRKSRKGLAKIM